MPKSIQTPRVISFDGMDGSGKTTLINNVKTELVSRGMQVMVVSEPRGTQFGKDIFSVVNEHTPDKLSQIYAFFAARAEVFTQKVVPFLKDNPKGLVLLDRHVFSTLAYQAGDDWDFWHVVGVLYSTLRWRLQASKNSPTGGDFEVLPELSVVCHIHPQLSIHRIQTRAKEHGVPLESWEQDRYEELVKRFEEFERAFKYICKTRGFSNFQFNILEVDGHLSEKEMADKTTQRICDTFSL